MKDTLGGLRIDVRQLLPNGGMLSVMGSTVANGDGFLLGMSTVEFGDLPWGTTRTTVGLGTLLTPLDGMNLHFSNLYPPSTVMLGAQTRVVYDRWTFIAASGRSQLYLGPGIPYLEAGPDKLTAITLLFDPTPRLKLEGRMLFTGAGQPIQFQGISAAEAAIRTPRQSQVLLFDTQYQWKPGFYWLGEVGMTHAIPQRGAENIASSGTSVSFFGGPYIQRKHYRLETNYVREGINYFPLSTEFIGDREGWYTGGRVPN